MEEMTELDRVYRERAYLVSHLAALYPSVLCASDEPGYALVYLAVPTGQLSWHIAERDLDLFEHVPKVAPIQWDGHDTPEKYRRLGMYTWTLATGRPHP